MRTTALLCAAALGLAACSGTTESRASSASSHQASVETSSADAVTLWILDAKGKG